MAALNSENKLFEQAENLQSLDKSSFLALKELAES